MLARLRYREAWGRWPNLKTPTTFDEKLLWLMLNWREPLKTLCGDKYTMRDYVAGKGLNHLLPHLYGVYESVEAISFASLPERFVLKCTHGCKCNLFCPDKRSLDIEAARRDLNRWMATDYSRFYGESHYAGMKPRILCEEFLNDGTGNLPVDYKVYCFSGVPYCILVCSDRVANGKANFLFMDLNWNRLAFYRNEPTGARVPARPAALAEILSAAGELSASFPFVRVDFFSIFGRAILGEMTFTPDACIDSSYTDDAQQFLGDLLKLPKRPESMGSTSGSAAEY